MKEVIQSIISAIIIVLPLPLLILFCYEFANSRHVVPVSIDNIEIVREQFKKINHEIEDNVIRVEMHFGIFQHKFYITYDNEETEQFSLDQEDVDENLIDFMSENDINNNLEIITISLIISIIASAYEIHKMNKVEVIY